MTTPLNIALIYGSTREGRMCDTVASWAVTEMAGRRDLALDIIDPLELALPDRLERDEGTSQQALRARIDRADGFIIVTPEYNHGYPAALKFLIDLVGEEWGAKPVGFISYGGAAGGLRAVEQLRLVFAELNAVTVRETVSFASVWEQFGANGRLAEPDRARRALGAMLKRLGWWGRALREARATLPYAQAA